MAPAGSPASRASSCRFGCSRGCSGDCSWNNIAPLRKIDWVVYAKRPFAGPEAVLAYLSRYTHRVAIANSRLIAFDEQGVTFKWKDYRAKEPDGFHRIRYYGLFANKVRSKHLARVRELLQIPPESGDDSVDIEPSTACVYLCKSCGAPMVIIETFYATHAPRAPPIGPP